MRAKAAVPVNGEPLARRVIQWLVASRVRDLVLNLHHRPASIAAVVGDGADLGARVRYSWEQPVLGSAGGPRHALSLLGDPFVLVNGDTLTDVNLAALAGEHHESRAAVTMALIPNPHPDKYGGVRVSEDGWVTGFTRRGTPGESFHFIGVQIARASVFAPLQDGVAAESVTALYPRMIAERPHSVRAFISRASFQDIGTPADYLRTCLELAESEGNRLTAGVRSQIDDSADVVRTAVWDDVTIGAHASLTDCVVADGASIPAGARYERAAIVPARSCEPEPGQWLDGNLLIAPLADSSGGSSGLPQPKDRHADR